jgi:hypothetical protein
MCLEGSTGKGPMEKRLPLAAGVDGEILELMGAERCSEEQHWCTGWGGQDMEEVDKATAGRGVPSSFDGRPIWPGTC